MATLASSSTYRVGIIYRTDNEDYVPIYSVDAVKLTRSHSTKVTPGIATAMFTTWTGTNAVTYDLNFELLVGWGDVTSREQLATFMSVFQGMGSHQTKSSTEAGLPPPTTRLVISRFVNMTGWLDQVTVEGFGPWGTQFIGGERTLLPTRCRFTGNFIMVPGINIESKAGGDILIQGNNHQLSSAVVRKNFYILGE